MREDWVETTLEEICNDGLFTDGDWVESKDQDPDGDYRLLQLADIGDGTFLNKSDRWMNEEQFRRLGCTELKVNDLLIARMPDPIGRACLLPEGLPASATVVDVAIVRTGDELLQRMLSLIVNSSEFRSEAFSLLTGTTRQRISRGNLSKISFWLPPLPEQKKIVDLISSVDSYIEALQQRLESATRSRVAAVHDKLARDVSHWTETRLIDVATVLDRYRRPINSEERELRKGSVPYYGANGQTGWIDDYIFDEELVLLGEDAIDFVDPNARKAYIISGPSWVNNHAHVLRADSEKVLTNILAELLNLVDYTQYVSFGTRSKLTQASMNEIRLLIPSLSEQKQISGLIQALDTSIVAANRTIDQTRKLRSALLAQLLSGEHEIPQDYDRVMSVF